MLAPAQGVVSMERRRSQLAGAASCVMASRSPSRRRRWAMSCVGSPVRTVTLWCGGRSTPLKRLRSSVHSSSSASTPRWRARSQTCSAASNRLADHMSSGALSASAGSSSFCSNLSGNVSQVWRSGCRPHAMSSASRRAAPKRRVRPARGNAATSPQVRHPMPASRSRCARAAVRVCNGKSASMSGAGVSLRANSRSRASAIRLVAP